MAKILVVFSTLFCLLASAQDPKNLPLSKVGKLSSLRVEGNQLFFAEDILSELGMNVQLYELSQQRGIEAGPYYEKVRELVQRAYRACGCPDAEVTSSFQKKIPWIHIKEGPVYRNGKIRIQLAEPLPEGLIVTDLENAIHDARNDSSDSKSENIVDSLKKGMKSKDGKDLFELGYLSNFVNGTKPIREALEQYLRGRGYYGFELKLELVREEEKAHLDLKITKSPKPSRVKGFSFEYELKAELRQFLLPKLQNYIGKKADRLTLAAVEKILKDSHQFSYIKVKFDDEKVSDEMEVKLTLIPWKLAHPLGKELPESRERAHQIGEVLSEIFTKQENFSLAVRLFDSKIEDAQYRVGARGIDGETVWAVGVGHGKGDGLSYNDFAISPEFLNQLGEVRMFIHGKANDEPTAERQFGLNFGLGVTTESGTKRGFDLSISPIFMTHSIVRFGTFFQSKTLRDGRKFAQWEGESNVIFAHYSADGKELQKVTFLMAPGSEIGMELSISPESDWIEVAKKTPIEAGVGSRIVMKELKNFMDLLDRKNGKQLDYRWLTMERTAKCGDLLLKLKEIFSKNLAQQSQNTDDFNIPLLEEERKSVNGTVMVLLFGNKLVNDFLPQKHQWRDFILRLIPGMSKGPFTGIDWMSLKLESGRVGPLDLLLTSEALGALSGLPKALGAEVVSKAIKKSLVKKDIGSIYDCFEHWQKAGMVEKKDLDDFLAGLSDLLSSDDLPMDFSSRKKAEESLLKPEILDRLLETAMEIAEEKTVIPARQRKFYLDNYNKYANRGYASAALAIADFLMKEYSFVVAKPAYGKAAKLGSKRAQKTLEENGGK